MTNQQQLELDYLLCGECFTVDGIRVDPSRVSHRVKPKVPIDDNDRTNEEWREKACGICNRHICRCGESNGR